MRRGSGEPAARTDEEVATASTKTDRVGAERFNPTGRFRGDSPAGPNPSP